jgi:hypothetical protein
MLEYPKRLYKNGKGHTVHSLEEERVFLNSSTKEEPVSVIEEEPVSVIEEEPVSVIEEEPVSVIEEELVEETEAEATGTEEEALEYIISNGYSKKSAHTILKKQGLESVLKHKAEGTDPQE